MAGSSDPFDDVVLDDSFVQAARRREPSAGERAAAARAERRSRRRERRVIRRRKLAVRTAQLAVFGGLVAAVTIVALDDSTTRSPIDRDQWQHGHLSDTATFVDPGGRIPTPQPQPELRQLPPVTTTVESEAFDVIAVGNDGRPIGYSPCTNVEFVVSAHGAPDNAVDVITEVLAELSAASGLSLVLDGFVNEPATTARPPFQPDRYGDRWAPVLIAWTNEREVEDLAGMVAGIGGSTHYELPGQRPYLVSGIAYLDGPQLASISDPAERHRATRRILLHELGHVLGLDHVTDLDQIMHPTFADLDQLGDGDRAGLAALGAIECAPML